MISLPDGLQTKEKIAFVQRKLTLMLQKHLYHLMYQIAGKRFGRTRTSQTSLPKGNFQPKEEGRLNLSLPGANSFRKLREWRADSLV